jgi:hypothetical protein
VSQIGKIGTKERIIGPELCSQLEEHEEGARKRIRKREKGKIRQKG